MLHPQKDSNLVKETQLTNGRARIFTWPQSPLLPLLRHREGGDSSEELMWLEGRIWGHLSHSNSVPKQDCLTKWISHCRAVSPVLSGHNPGVLYLKIKIKTSNWLPLPAKTFLVIYLETQTIRKNYYS